MDAHFVFRLLSREILIYGTFYLTCFLQDLCMGRGMLAHGRMKGGSMIRTDVPARFIDFLNLNSTLRRIL